MGSHFDWSQLQHPKALADALSSNVCWARVKGYPYWPAQVLNDGAAQKKLGKIKHTADAVPVMFFGTLEIAWIGQSDIVCFKDGVLQGFLVKGKHKSFLKACGQVYEFLMLDKKRRAPQYWWCRAPSNGLDAGPEEESNPTSSKPISPAFSRPTSKAHTPKSAPSAPAGHTPGSEAEDEERNESASEAEEQEAVLLCAAPKEGKVCKLPPPSKRRAALPPPAPKQHGRPANAGGTKAAGAGRQAAERKGNSSGGVGVGGQHGTWARDMGSGSSEGSGSSGSSSEDEGAGSRGGTAGAAANGGSGKTAAQEKKGKPAAAAAQLQPGSKRPTPSQSKQQQANGTGPKGGWFAQAQMGEGGGKAASVAGASSHLPPKKKLRTAAEAGEAKPGIDSAAAAATAVAVGSAGERAAAWPEVAAVKQEEPQEQAFEGSKDCQQQQQQQNSGSTAATTTTTQLQAPPSFPRQHSCMEIEEDVSASLPAEIRRLAGIKLVKRPPPGAASTEPLHNINGNTSNNNGNNNGNNNNSSNNSHKAGGSKGAQRSSAPSCLLVSPKLEQAAESPRRSREDAEACGKGAHAAAGGQCSMLGLQSAASADLEGAAATGGGGPEALLSSRSAARQSACLGSSSQHGGDGALASEHGLGGVKGLAAVSSVPVTGSEVTVFEAGLGGSATEGSEAAACAAAAAAEAHGGGAGTGAGGREEASPGAGMPKLAGPPAAGMFEEQGSVKEEVVAEPPPPPPQPLPRRKGGGRGGGREGKEGGKQAAWGKEVGNGGGCVSASAAAGSGKAAHAASEQEREQERREEREQLLQRKRDRERERRLQLKAQRQRELLALGDANDLSGSELAAGGSGSGSGSEAYSGAEGGAVYEGRLGEGSHRAHAASSRKRRRRHRQAHAVAAALGGGSDGEGGEAAGAGEHGEGGAGVGCGLQGDGAAPMDCEGRLGGAGRMQGRGGLGLESPRRPGARERAREARRRQRQAEALREAREAQQQQDAGTGGWGEGGHAAQQQKEAAGIQRVLRDRHACGSSRERGGGRTARGEAVLGRGSLLSSRVGSVHHQNGKGAEGVRGGRARSSSEAEKPLSHVAAQQQQAVQGQVQQQQQHALMQQQAQLQQQRQQKQQRREARAAERAQARAEAREAAMANALRLVGVGVGVGVDSSTACAATTEHHPSQAPQPTPFSAPCYPLLPPVYVLPPPLAVGEDRIARGSGHSGAEGGRPRRSSGSAVDSSDCAYEVDEDAEEADLVMGDEGLGSPLPSASASDSYTDNGEPGMAPHSPRGHLTAHETSAAAAAAAGGKAEAAPCRRSSRNTAAAQAAATAGRGSMEEEMLDAEAAEVLQLMQSMDPEHAAVGPKPGASSREGTTPSSNSNKGVHSNAGGSAVLRAASVQLDVPLAATPSPVTRQPEVIVPRAPLHSCQGFVWPEEEPLLPEEPEPFLLPKVWLLARPPRYEHIKRNVWVSRMRPKRITSKDVSRCTCRPSYVTPDPTQPHVKQLGWGCAEHCLNRHSYIHCDPKNCPCGEACSNRPFHLLKGPSMEAFLTENRGYGVRATEPAPRGSFLLEYAGEIIDEPELAKRMEAARVAGEPCFYIMDLGAGLYVDARHRGNLARLLNSSCDPNCETQKWHDAATGEPRIGIFATRDIKPGEELTYDYFFQHYGVSAVDTADFICMCGAPNCRGTMDINPGKRKDLGRRIEVHWDGDGVYYRGTVVGYTATSRRHVIMYDDGDKERLCLDTVPHKWLDDEEDDVEDTSIPNGPTSARKAAAAAAAAALLPHAGGSHAWGTHSRSADLSPTDASALDFLGAEAAHGGGGGAGSSRRHGSGGVPPKKRQRSSTSGGQVGGPGGSAAARGGSGRLRGEGWHGSLGAGGCDMALLLQAVESELTGGLEEGGGGKSGMEPLLPSSAAAEDGEAAAEEEEEEEETASMQEVAGMHPGAPAPPHPQAQHAVQQRGGRGAARRQQLALQKEQQAAAAAAAQQQQQQQEWDESPQQQQQQQQPQHYGRHAPHSAGAAALRQQQQQQQQAEEQQDAGTWSRNHHHHHHHHQDTTHNHTRPPEPRSRLSIIEEAVGIRISSFALPLFHNQPPPRSAPEPPEAPSLTDPHTHKDQQPLQPRHSLSSTPSASAPHEPQPAPVPTHGTHDPSYNATSTGANNSSSHKAPLQPSLGGPAAALNALGASAEGALQNHQHHRQQQQHPQQRKPTWRPTPPSPALSAALGVLVSSPTLASLSSMPGVIAKAGNVNLFQAGAAAASSWEPGTGKAGSSSHQQQLTHSLAGLGHTYMPHWGPGLGVPVMHTHFAQN